LPSQTARARDGSLATADTARLLYRRKGGLSSGGHKGTGVAQPFTSGACHPGESVSHASWTRYRVTRTAYRHYTAMRRRPPVTHLTPSKALAGTIRRRPPSKQA